MDNKIWFGNVVHAQWAPAPATGMVRSREGYSEEIQFDNGLMWLNRTHQTSMSFEMDFPVKDASDYYGIEVYERFAAGEYDSTNDDNKIDLLRFVDPMQSDRNLFSEVWAAPGLSERGYKPIYFTTPTYADVAANSYGKPRRSAVYNITSSANAEPAGQNNVFTLLIPTGHTLHLGASGSVTGTGRLRVQPINMNGSYASVVDITLSAEASAPALSNTFSGDTYKAVLIYLTRTTTATSEVRLNSAWAQILPTGKTPYIVRHVPGEGHVGMKFRGSVQAQDYIMTDGHKVGAHYTLVEVESAR